MTAADLAVGDVFEFASEPTKLDDRHELHFLWGRVTWKGPDSLEYDVVAQAGDYALVRVRRLKVNRGLAGVEVVRRECWENPIAVALGCASDADPTL